MGLVDPAPVTPAPIADPAPAVTPPVEVAFKPIVLDSQEAVDKMFQDRAAQATRVAEKKAREDRKELEAKIKAFEDAQLTEDQRRDQRVAEAEKLAAERGEELTKLQRQILVRDLAGDLPKSLWDRVRGDTEEEIKADIAQLKADFPAAPVATGPGAPPSPSPTVTVSPPGGTPDPELSADALLDSISRTGNPRMDQL